LPHEPWKEKYGNTHSFTAGIENRPSSVQKAILGQTEKKSIYVAWYGTVWHGLTGIQH
jgi:hypothetical protein